LKRLGLYAARGHDGAALSGPRGPARQLEQRTLERAVRQAAVDLTTCLQTLHCTTTTVADLLHLAARTLRHWCQALRQRPKTLTCLGRPTQRAPLPIRRDLLEVLHDVGPGASVASLRHSFPDMGRRELDDFLRRYRAVWRQQHRALVHVLRWPVPGRVWAMDFTQTPTPIEGLYPYLLAVRDLASGRQLLALPTPDVQEPTVQAALASLFAEHGAPLVLKMDNGSAFRARAAQEYLRHSAVTSLFSPPRLPSYNGAIEAGIASLKTRIDRRAAHQGRPGGWTWDDVQAALQEANTMARPHGANGPSPDQAWFARSPVGADERENFLVTLAAYRAQELAHATGPDPAAVRGAAWDLLWTQTELAGEDRRAVRRTLEACGYLFYARRRIQLPIPRPQTARIA
jgi:transposase InsO family protein